MRKRITRAQYHTLLANCAAKINLEMERLKLAPSELQDLSVKAVMAQTQTKAITMQDLNTYRQGISLPKDEKLKALAAVLKIHPDDLVPRDHQTGRVLVQRKTSSHPEYPSDLAHAMQITELPNLPGYAQLKATVVLPTAKVYALAAALVKQHNMEEARRSGMKEEDIKALLNPAPATP